MGKGAVGRGVNRALTGLDRVEYSVVYMVTA
jgi:hypothetical protein